MAQIYQAHMTKTTTPPAATDTPLRLRENTDATTGWVREALHEIDTHFPQLPNPTLFMYVYPHLAGPERLPVPGYLTSFPLYERVEYALPGEVKPSRGSRERTE